MNLLGLIDKLYDNNYFATILIVAIIVLVILFIVVLLLGIKDAKESKEPKKVKEEEVKDITFEPETKEPPANEDVTFEMPVLTKNLEDFKKSFEEEIQKDQEVEVRTTTHNSLSEATKPMKILDINAIEDTAILDTVIDTSEKKEDSSSPKEITKSSKEPVKETTKEPIFDKTDDDKLHFLEDDDF